VTLPVGYVDSHQEPDGEWCVTVRKKDGKRIWCFGKTLDAAMAWAIQRCGASR
jgi:hypothetical protein